MSEGIMLFQMSVAERVSWSARADLRLQHTFSNRELGTKHETERLIECDGQSTAYVFLFESLDAR